MPRNFTYVPSADRNLGLSPAANPLIPEAGGSNYSNIVLRDRPIAYWRLGEGVGSTTFADSSGFNRNGTVNGTPTFGVTGAIKVNSDTAVRFNADGDYLQVADDTDLRLNDNFSIECWVNPGYGNTTLHSFPSILGKDANTGGAGGSGYMMFFSAAWQSWAGTCIGIKRNGFENNSFDNALPLIDNTWNHVVWTYDKVTNQVLLYINALKGIDTTRTYGDNVETGIFTIGTRDSYIALGSIDEVALYNTVLSPSIVQEHYFEGLDIWQRAISNKTGSTWVNPTSVAIPRSISKNFRNAIVGNTFPFARNFTRASNELITLSLGGTAFADTLTVVAIVRKTADGIGQRFILYAGTLGGSTLWNFGTISDDRLSLIKGANDIEPTSLSLTSADGWCLVAVSHPSNGTPRFHKYVYSTGTWTHADGTGTLADANIPTGNLYLGNRPDGLSGIDGDIAIAGVWNANLSDAQIQNLPLTLTPWFSQVTPQAILLLNQESIATTVKDLSGNGANEVSHTGTTVSTSLAPQFAVGISSFLKQVLKFLTFTVPRPGFPTNSTILDSFDRADEGPPPSASWTATWRALGIGGGSLKVATNVCAGQNAGADAINNAYYSAAQYGPDCEVYATLSTKGGADDEVGIAARIAQPGVGTVDCYYARAIVRAGTDEWSLRRYDNDVETTISDIHLYEISAGDALGMTCLGSKISLWRKPTGGEWTLLQEVTDATYANSGYLGALIEGSTARLNDFGGGSYIGNVSLSTTTGAVTKVIVATVATSATLIKKVLKNLTATVATGASLIKQVGKLVVFAQAGTTSILKRVGKFITPPVGTSAFDQEQIGKNLSINTPTTTTLRKLIGRTIAFTQAGGAFIIKQVGKFVTPTVGTSGFDQEQIGKNLSINTPTTTTLRRFISKTIAFAQITVASVVKAITHGAFLITDPTITTIRKQVGKIASAIVTTPTGDTEQVGKNQTIVTPTVGSVIKQIGKTIFGTVISVVIDNEQVGKIVSIIASSTVSIPRQIGKFFNVSVATTGSVIKKVLKTLAATVNTVVSLNNVKVFLKTLIATVNTTVSLLRSTLYGVVNAVNTVVTFPKNVGHGMFPNVVTVLSPIKQVGKNIFTTVAGGVTLFSTKILLKMLTVTVTSTVSVFKSIGHNTVNVVNTILSGSKIVGHGQSIQTITILTPIKQIYKIINVISSEFINIPRIINKIIQLVQSSTTIILTGAQAFDTAISVALAITGYVYDATRYRVNSGRDTMARRVNPIVSRISHKVRGRIR